jgi:AraC-like DNA-binding protein
MTGVRAASAAFDALGLDTSSLRKAAGIDERLFENPDGELPVAIYYEFWSAAEREWSSPALGLAAGSAVPFGAYEVLDYLALTAPTLGEALRSLSRYFRIAVRTAGYELDESGPEVRVVVTWRMPGHPVMLQMRDYILTTLARRVRDLSGTIPLRVDLAGPALTTLGHYRAAFGTPVSLHTNRNALAFSHAQMGALHPRRDEQLHRTLRRHAELLLERCVDAADTSCTQRVRCELLRSVRVGVPAIDEIARALGSSGRTLQRQLRAEGTAFRQLADEVRIGLAAEYLRDPALSVGEVAFLVGFSGTSAFSRAFRRWAGASPERFRSGRTPPAHEAARP